MSSTLIWRNLATYSLQVGLLIGLAAFVPAMVRMRMPRARLAYWYILLAICLLLPFMPGRPEVLNDAIQVTSVVVAVGPQAPASRTMPWNQVGLALLIVGAVARLAWLAAGFWKLRHYRRRSEPLQNAPAPGVAEFRISADVSGPVTFGWRHPVVLLPERFPQLEIRMRDAILCHELLHIERGDWLVTIGEEIVRAVFWFHPAIWWLLGEIQLAREQAVDREVIDRTKSRDEYVDALLAIAGHHPETDLAPAPAPLFLKKRHLKERVVSILKEVRMSRTKIISTLAAGVGILAVAGWFVTVTFPLAAAPQSDAAGVSVDLGGGTVLHRTPVAYPESARARGIRGTVTLEVKLDSAGNVADARVTGGPEELRSPALQSVLQWHFARESAGQTRQVSITFQPAPAAASGTGQSGARESAQAKAAQQAAVTGRTIRNITVSGLSESQRAELLSRLPIHQGDVITPELMARATAAVKEFDEHLTLFAPTTADGSANVLIVAPRPSAAVPEPAPVKDASAAPDRIKVGGNVQQTKLISKVRPVYPPDAKAARVQGVVKLLATIGKDGAVQNLELISGDPLLVPSAMEAVRQWVYETTLLNGNPVEVVTQIDINYTLSQ